VTVLTALTALCVATALWLAGGPRARLPDHSDARQPGAASGRLAVVGLLGAATTLAVTLDGTRLVLGLVLVGTAAGALELARRARRARVADQRRAQVVEVCEALTGELRAGQPFVAALEHCCGSWPSLVPVLAAARLDADVPAALRRVAALPGAEGLTDVAAAWQVSSESGSGLAGALGQVAASARARQGTQALVRGELASAQATARLVALLPVASLAMSSGVGGDPWHFLLATMPGLACLAAGIACGFAGLLWIDRIAAAVLEAGG
jgi:tight adherence protein B